jgi:ribosomal protein S18 acetylase RimI-like enzyme
MKRLASKAIDFVEEYDFDIHFRRYDLKDIIFITKKDGKSSGSIYRYLDDREVFYIANVAVEEFYRGQGLGNELLTMLEQIAVILEAKVVYLKVKRDMWMYNWYSKYGYKDDKIEEDFIWLKKLV